VALYNVDSDSVIVTQHGSPVQKPFSINLYDFHHIWFCAMCYIVERKVCRRILGQVYDSKKENWRIVTNKEIYAIVIGYSRPGRLHTHETR
jgi:hypothetical protein